MPSVPEDFLNQKMEELDNFEIEKKILPIKLDEELDKIMNLTQIELRVMTAAELGEAAYVLAKYAYYVSSLTNRETSEANIAEESLKNIVGKHYSQYKSQYSSYEEVKGKIVAGNEAAAEFNKLRILAKARLDRLSYLSSKIQFMAQTLIELKKTKEARR